MYNLGITFGVWDLLHTGHVKFLQTCKTYTNSLIVGVAGDEITKVDKGEYPIVSEGERCYMISSLKVVDSTEVYKQLEFLTLLNKHNPDVLFVGEQWGTDKRHLDANKWISGQFKNIIHLPRTKHISSSLLKKILEDRRN